MLIDKRPWCEYLVPYLVLLLLLTAGIGSGYPKG